MEFVPWTMATAAEFVVHTPCLQRLISKVSRRNWSAFFEDGHACTDRLQLSVPNRSVKLCRGKRQFVQSVFKLNLTECLQFSCGITPKPGAAFGESTFGEKCPLKHCLAMC